MDELSQSLLAHRIQDAIPDIDVQSHVGRQLAAHGQAILLAIGRNPSEQSAWDDIQARAEMWFDIVDGPEELTEHYICLKNEPGQVNGQLKAWQKNPEHNEHRLYWEDQGVAYSPASFKDAMVFVLDRLDGVCGMHLHIRNGQPGNLYAQFTRIDGQGGVLAQHYLPGPNTPTTRSLEGQWDSGENPSQRALNWVTLHEICHGLGLGHKSGVVSLMNPSLNLSIYPEVDEWTKRELQRRYGPPRPRSGGDSPTDPDLVSVARGDLKRWINEMTAYLGR